MRIIGKERLKDFEDDYPDSKPELDAWEKEVEDAKWKVPQDISVKYPSADFPGKLQVIFDICGNKYRLLVQVAYQTGIVLIKAIGTHKQYDKWKIK